MMDNQSRPLKQLTPNERVNAEKKAYEAFLRQAAIYNPEPEPDSRDIVHDNPFIARALVWAVSVIPGILAVILASAIFISADRTFTAFSEASAHNGTIWASFIGLLGVVFTEFSLVFVEFASVRSRLQRNLPRQVWTLPKFLRGIGVRLGLREPLDYNAMPDTNLERFASMVFILVLAANIFVGVMPLLETNGTSWAAMTDLARMKLVFAIFMGIVAPVGLRFVGGQLASLSYSLYDQQRAELRQALHEDWRKEMTSLWEDQAPRIIAEALHARFCQKNALPIGTESPYLLVTGDGEEGDAAEVHLVPLASSQANSARPSSRN